MSTCLLSGQPTIDQGTLDLRMYTFDDHTVLPMEGSWIFQKDVLNIVKSDSAPEEYMDLPGVWAEDLSGFGHGTYHLKIIFPSESAHYALEIPYMYTAFRVYMDTILIAHNGHVATEAMRHKSQFKPVVAGFYARDTVQLSIQVSNYQDRKGGMWAAPKLGLSHVIMSSWTLRLMLEAFIIGALFIIGFYQIMIYVMRPEDRSTLYFGIFCIALAFRGLCVGHVLINYLAPQLSWMATARIEYISMFLLSPLFILFVDELFSGYISLWIKRSWVLATLIVMLVILLTDKVVFGQLLYLIVVGVIICAFIVFRAMIRAYRDDKKGALNALIGAGIFAMATINDILYGFEVINTGNFLEYGLLAFIIIQALNIAYMFGKAFEDVKQLTLNLQETNQSYSRFIPAQFLSFLGKDDITKVVLGDQRRAEMSILFVDIRSFTALSETMSPQENFDFINSYFKKISPVITANGGFVDKFIGDAIMSLFPNSVEDCINAAIGMHEVLRDYNDQRTNEGLSPIKIGIGLHVGSVMLGTVGEPQRMDTTVISDAVNLASRLEGLAKHYNVPILTTLSTLHILKDANQYPHRLLHIGQVKGRSELVTLVEIISVKTDPQAASKVNMKPTYEAAIALFEDGQYKEAKDLFDTVAQTLTQDRATLEYLDRCEKIIAQTS